MNRRNFLKGLGAVAIIAYTPNLLTAAGIMPAPKALLDARAAALAAHAADIERAIFFGFSGRVRDEQERETEFKR